jgi:hypothetical protein
VISAALHVHKSCWDNWVDLKPLFLSLQRIGNSHQPRPPLCQREGLASLPQGEEHTADGSASPLPKASQWANGEGGGGREVSRPNFSSASRFNSCSCKHSSFIVNVIHPPKSIYHHLVPCHVRKKPSHILINIHL